MNNFTIHQGDCLEILRTLPDRSVDAVVTDPPYHLTANKKGGSGAASVNLDSPYGRARIGTGFMGMTWDGGDIAFRPEVWAEALRVLKPGGHLLAFSGSRTYHRMVCAIEDAGFEIRDQIMWLYGSGFPKSRDVCGDMGADDAQQWSGWGTALKPAHEPIVMARKPFPGTVAGNLIAHGTGALNIDCCRVPTEAGASPSEARRASARRSGVVPSDDTSGRTSFQDRTSPERYMQERAGEALGRWPANVIHDGSDEVLAAFPQAPGQMAAVSTTAPSEKTSRVYGRMRREGEASAGSDNQGAVGFKMKPGMRRLDEGSAARFFFCAKASRADRNAGTEGLPQGNHHPTVKPTELMRYLCRLVTPPGGVVLDPFMGSGSTGKAALLEGFRFIGIEREAAYIDIARARIEDAAQQMRPKANDDTPPQGDLFAA